MTFNLPNIKPNFGSTASTIGNKKALGIIGSDNTTYDGYTGCIKVFNINGNILAGISSTGYNETIGTYLPGGTPPALNTPVGITTDADKSGLITILNTIDTINYYIKY